MSRKSSQVSKSKYMCVSCTLSLEGVQVVSEGVCWFSLLQDAQVTKFLYLCFFRLPLPYCDHHLNTHKQLYHQQQQQSGVNCVQLCVSKNPEITDNPPYFDFQGADGKFVQGDGEGEDHFICQNHRLVQRRLTWRNRHESTVTSR